MGAWPQDSADRYRRIVRHDRGHIAATCAGPPPHFHKTENEFFLVIHGALDVMVNGEWRRCAAGSFLDLQPNTTHTFINNTQEDAVWITGWRPKGFERFFGDFGISAVEPHAQDRSVADEIVQQVVQNVERYGMYLAQ